MVQGHYREKKAQVFIVSSFSPFENLLMINASSHHHIASKLTMYEVLLIKCQGRINVTENHPRLSDLFRSRFILKAFHSFFSKCESQTNFKSERDRFSFSRPPPLCAHPSCFATIDNDRVQQTMRAKKWIFQALNGKPCRGMMFHHYQQTFHTFQFEVSASEFATQWKSY